MKLKENIAVSESGFLFDPTTGDSYSLNQIGLDFFQMIKEEKTKDEIKKIILDKYDTDEITFEKSYLDFINMLSHNQLIVHDE